ncbi:MAG TPA: twin-arginine translocase subunit TatC [Limnochordales bacterium]|nr:twin-arginine translocase subunit TatC [Limnochordales bacterium]
MSAESSAETTVEFQDLLQRLNEVRTRLIRSFLFLLAASILAYLFSERALDDMQARLPVGSEMIFLAPSEAFVARIKLALAGGLVLAFPFLMYQILAFVSPYLSRRDRRMGLLLIPLSFGLFLTGAGFSYAVMLPFALRFLLGFGAGELEPMLSISPFVNFVLFLVLPLGLIFQLPIVMVFLTRLGIVDPVVMARNRKYAVFAIFVISAVLTPADVFSQLLMAGPLLVLYEFSLLIARLARRRPTP